MERMKTWRLLSLMYDQTRMKQPKRDAWDWPKNSRSVDGRFTRSIKLASFFGLSVIAFFIRCGSIVLNCVMLSVIHNPITIIWIILKTSCFFSYYTPLREQRKNYVPNDQSYVGITAGVYSFWEEEINVQWFASWMDSNTSEAAQSKGSHKQMAIIITLDITQCSV